MQKATTKAMAKVAAVATGLAMATSMLSLAPMAHAAGLTASQIQNILGLLTSFGADATTVANVQASLTGGTPAVTTTTTSAPATSGYTFSKSLTVGSTGADVTALQNILISKGYLNVKATGYFGALTRAAVAKWQAAVGIKPAVGFFGIGSRAVMNAAPAVTTTTTTTTTTPATTATGTGLKVALAATSPNGSVLVQNQAIGDLADFVFTNPTSAPINVTALSFNRVGVSNDSTLTNVYLYNNGTRLTDSAGVSSSAFSYTNAAGLFTVPANGTYTVSVRSDIANTTSGQQIGVQLTSVQVAAGSTVDASFSPITSGYQTISAASLAAVDYNNTPATPSATSISPQNDFPVWQNTIGVSTNPVKLSSIKFTNLGSIDSTYVTNLRLYVDGTQVGAAVPTMAADRTVTFDLTAAPVMLSTQGHVVKVLANITGGASRTIQFSVQRTADAMFVDSQLGQPVTPTVAGLTFTANSAGIITINSVTSGSGVSVSLAPNSPTQAVAVGASSVKWASFNMLASGENVKVSDLYVYASSTKSNGALAGTGGLKNGKIYLNGVQVGSTKDIGSLVAGATDFSLGSSLILPAGQSVTVDIYADAKTLDNVNIAGGGSVVVSLNVGSSNAQGQSSLNSTNVPAAITSGNSVSVSASSLTATKYTGYGDQKVIPGATGAKIGAFTLSAGSTEGVTVNTINFSLPSVTSTLTNLTIKDDATGATLGSVISTPSTSNSFAVNLDIPVSSSKTIDIYGDILSGANAGSIQATITASTAGTGDLTGTSAAAAQTALQTITLGSGVLTATRGAGDPVSNVVLAGASSVQVGEFNFAAQNSAFTVRNLAILVPNGAATAVTSVTLKYKDSTGTLQTVSQPLSVNAANAYATATFTGLTMYVPVNDSANLDVYVGTPTIASAGANISGAAIKVSLDEGNTSSAVDNTFSATNAAGTAITTVASGATLASNGTFYVRKSIPTFAMIPTGNTVPSTGTPLYKFSISADPAGAIEWTHLVFNISTTSTVLSNLYLTDDASGNNLLDVTTGSAPTGTFTVNLPSNSTQAQYAQVAAGATKTYDLYGTVTGWPTGASLTINLASDGTATSTASSAANTGVNENTVWSDRSASAHATTTADWTNGYLLKNFTSNAVSYSK